MSTDDLKGWGIIWKKETTLQLKTSIKISVVEIFVLIAILAVLCNHLSIAAKFLNIIIEKNEVQF